MKDDQLLLRYRKMVSKLADLPKRMVALYDLDAVGSIPEYILHDLAHEDFFNLKKAAFLVDNPEFDLLKGIAGVSKEERFLDNHWDQPENFNKHMGSSDFNNKVKSLCECSHKKNNKSPESVLEKVAVELDLVNPEYKVWPLKHYNHGFLIYERDFNHKDEVFEENFLSCLHLFGFCPLH